MALDDLPDEHEQSEKVRHWLRSNALGLVGGLALGLALIGGWKWWQNHAHQQRVATSEIYLGAVDSIEAGDLEKAKAQAATLEDGAYAEIIALALAKAQIDADDRDGAIETLRRVSTINTGNPGLEAVIKQRLARLLIDAEKAEEALALLGDSTDAASLETRGDARFSLGRTDEAREDYAAALRQLDIAAPQRGLLELKLAETGGEPATTETQS
ncbi:MAG: tetratricopeptide repeat protein [Luteimonas sp.]|nr:tetratricopeptide repeat protein [Luteimonas sp.]